MHILKKIIKKKSIRKNRSCCRMHLALKYERGDHFSLLLLDGCFYQCFFFFREFIFIASGCFLFISSIDWSLISLRGLIEFGCRLSVGPKDRTSVPTADATQTKKASHFLHSAAGRPWNCISSYLFIFTSVIGSIQRSVPIEFVSIEQFQSDLIDVAG